MKEYEVTFRFSFFTKKVVYVEAESVSKLVQEIEEGLWYEIMQGLTYQIKSV